jgi:uncharacterized protein
VSETDLASAGLAAATPSARLCTACGACCNGTIFDEVPLARHEIALGARLSLPIVAAGDEAAMPLPCPRLAGATCTIYDERPSTCRTYRCGLLVDVEEGRVEEGEALARVRALRAAAEHVRASLPGDTRGVPIFRAAERFAESLGGRRSAAYQEGHADLVLAVEALGRALRAVTRSRLEHEGP